MADEADLTATSETTTTDVVDTTALGGDTTDTSATDGGTVLGGEADTVVEKTPEEIAAEADAAEAAKIPEAYELTAPEGVTLDAAAIEAATPVFKELGLSNEQANKLMPVAAQFAQSITDKFNNDIMTQVTAERKGWLDTAKNDPEIGGPNWDKSIHAGAQALDALGFTKGSPFRNLLNDSGLGNHPEMIRAFAKVGAAIGDDGTFTRGNGATTTKRDIAETLYPDDVPKGGQ